MSKPKTQRCPRAKAGELKLKWGKHPDYHQPDIIYANGEGTSHCDSHLLHSVFSCESLHYDVMAEGHCRVDKSFIAELESRGYDLTTIKFSIQKKQPEQL